MTEPSGTLAKSYSFDNVTFSVTTADPKDVALVQKAIQTLSTEMTADLAKFTADEMATAIKSAGPTCLVQAGAIDKLKAMVADNATKANAYIAIASMATIAKNVCEVGLRDVCTAARRLSECFLPW